MFEPHHAKTGLKILFVVISKEGLAGTSPALFGMTRSIKYNLFKQCTNSTVGVIPKEGLAGPMPRLGWCRQPSLFLYETGKDHLEDLRFA